MSLLQWLKNMFNKSSKQNCALNKTVPEILQDCVYFKTTDDIVSKEDMRKLLRDLNMHILPATGPYRYMINKYKSSDIEMIHGNIYLKIETHKLFKKRNAGKDCTYENEDKTPHGGHSYSVEPLINVAFQDMFQSLLHLQHKDFAELNKEPIDCIP